MRLLALTLIALSFAVPAQANSVKNPDQMPPKVAEKSETKIEEKAPEKTEAKTEEKTVARVEEKAEEKAEEKIEVKTEEEAEEKSAERAAADMMTVSPTPPVKAAPALPEEAKPFVAEYQTAHDALRTAYEKQVKALRDKLVEKLKPLQDKYTRDAKLDEAVAIRDKINALGGPQKIAAWHVPQPNEIGQTFLYEVTANTNGPVWGTDIYTSDSSPATAAIHAGVLKPDETATLQISIVEGPSAWPGSERNGISSQSWGAWPVGYRISKAED